MRDELDKHSAHLSLGKCVFLCVGGVTFSLLIHREGWGEVVGGVNSTARWGKVMSQRPSLCCFTEPPEFSEQLSE